MLRCPWQRCEPEGTRDGSLVPGNRLGVYHLHLRLPPNARPPLTTSAPQDVLRANPDDLTAKRYLQDLPQPNPHTPGRSSSRALTSPIVAFPVGSFTRDSRTPPRALTPSQDWGLPNTVSIMLDAPDALRLEDAAMPTDIVEAPDDVRLQEPQDSCIYLVDAGAGPCQEAPAPISARSSRLSTGSNSPVVRVDSGRRGMLRTPGRSPGRVVAWKDEEQPKLQVQAAVEVARFDSEMADVAAAHDGNDLLVPPTAKTKKNAETSVERMWRRKVNLWLKLVLMLSVPLVALVVVAVLVILGQSERQSDASTLLMLSDSARHVSKATHELGMERDVAVMYTATGEESYRSEWDRHRETVDAAFLELEEYAATQFYALPKPLLMELAVCQEFVKQRKRIRVCVPHALPRMRARVPQFCRMLTPNPRR